MQTRKLAVTMLGLFALVAILAVIRPLIAQSSSPPGAMDPASTPGSRNLPEMAAPIGVQPSDTQTASSAGGSCFLPLALKQYWPPCTQDEDGGTVELWKCPYRKRSDFYVGALVCDYLAKRDWGPFFKQLDPIAVMKENGFEWMRAWVTTRSDPYLRSTPASEWHNLPWRDSYWSSLEWTGQILKEAAARGYRLDLVFFLSDEGAHAGTQNPPPEWDNLSVEETARALEQYTYETTQYYEEQGLNIELYEIGNEIEWGILGFYPGQRVPIPPDIGPWPDISYLRSHIWSIEAQLLKAAIAGVRRADPEAKTVLHIDTVMWKDNTDDEVVWEFFRFMVEEQVPFEYAGLSCPYPLPSWVPASYTSEQFFARLESTVDFVATLRKPVMISEAAYPWYHTEAGVQPMPDYSFTPEGQAAWARDQLRFTSNHPNVAGFFYWYPDWFPDNNPYSPAFVQSIGLLANDTTPLPAMAEFRVNLP